MLFFLDVKMSKPPKAQSVDKDGNEDGFIPPIAYQRQVLHGGYTRLEISAPPDKLQIVHRYLADRVSMPCKLRYVKMTDRETGQQLSKPKSYVAVEVSKERLMQALDTFADLFYHDGRNQLWIRGLDEEQIVLDELGMIYTYPDDFLFREALAELGWLESSHQSMASRDYVRVNFLSSADAQEKALIQSLGMIQY